MIETQIDKSIEDLVNCCNKVLTEIKEVRFTKMDLESMYASIDVKRKNASIELAKINAEIEEKNKLLNDRKDQLASVFKTWENELKARKEELDKKAKSISDSEYLLSGKHRMLIEKENEINKHWEENKKMIDEYMAKKKKLEEILK